jgi:hypothetical protein
MPIYTATDACQKFDQLLDEAKQQQEVIIKRADNEVFILKLVVSTGFPYTLPTLDVGLTRDEIVSYIREVRER